MRSVPVMSASLVLIWGKWARKRYWLKFFWPTSLVFADIVTNFCCWVSQILLLTRSFVLVCLVRVYNWSHGFRMPWCKLFGEVGRALYFPLLLHGISPFLHLSTGMPYFWRKLNNNWHSKQLCSLVRVTFSASCKWKSLRGCLYTVH